MTARYELLQRNPIKVPALGGRAATKMFQKSYEAGAETYKRAMCDRRQLAAGEEKIECVGEGSWEVGKVSLKNSIHVDGLNSSFISV